MNLGPDKSNIVENLIKTHKPRVFIEYGGYIGYSAIRLGAALRTAFLDGQNPCEGANPPSYYVFERDPAFARIATRLIELAGLSNVVKVVVGESSSSIHLLHANKAFNAVDMILFDHDESQYVADLVALHKLKLLRHGTIIVADNVVIPGAPDYLEYIASGMKGEKYETRKIGSYLPFGIPEPLEVTTVIEA